jgi:hypothetical protein
MTIRARRGADFSVVFGTDFPSHSRLPAGFFLFRTIFSPAQLNLLDESFGPNNIMKTAIGDPTL